jgi:predicted SnoaL-like aldol condensation-catalyzing enzyme
VDCHFANEDEAMSNKTSEQNKAIVLEAFQTLFNKRDYTAAERFWSPNYIQHSAHIPAGREGLLGMIRNLPPTLKYEPGVTVADGDYVIIHGRFSGIGLPTNWIVADVVRLKDGTKQQSKSGNPMFGDAFPK